MSNQAFSTKQIHAAHSHIPGIAPLVTPIFQSSTFVFQDTAQGARRFAGQEEGYIYTRIGNPNIDEVAQKVAELEGAESGMVMSSGMGAISSVMWTLLRAGDHLIADNTLYGCTFSYFIHGLTRFGVDVTLVNTSNIEEVEANIRPKTRAIYFESLTNPVLKLNDIPAICALAKKHGITTVADNTFLSPFLLRPIELGVDIVVHSATKYLNGHGDVIAGIAVGKRDFIREVRMFGVKEMTGAVIGPFEAFLLNRSLKTLDIRMQKHCKNALAAAEFLESHPAVKSVSYAGLKSHPQHALAEKLLPNGFSGMVSFELNCSKARAEEFINSLKLCTLAVSLGDVETLVEHPASMTHSAYSPEELKAANISETLIRLSVGLEDADDIITDLKVGLDKIR